MNNSAVASFGWVMLIAFLASSLFAAVAFSQDPRETPDDVRRAVREGRIDVTVEGREITEDEEVAIATGFRSLLGDAIGAVIEDGTKKTLAALDSADDIEDRLIRRSLSSGDGPTGGDDSRTAGGHTSLSIYLIRGGDPSEPPRSIDLWLDGKPFIRYSRIHADVDRPIALVTETRAVDDAVLTTERIMRYDSSSKRWDSRRPKTLRRELQLDDRQAEQSHATEPAAGPGSNGKPSPPAR